MENKNPNPASIIVEIIIAAVFVFVVMGVLNYFNILPLSRALPGLSFLPSQRTLTDDKLAKSGLRTGSDNSQALNGNGSITLKPIITPDNAKVINNDTETTSYNFIGNGTLKVTGPISIQTELEYDSQNQNTKDTSGLIFSNGLPYESDDRRALRIFRYPFDKTWVLEFRSKGESKYFPFSKNNENKSFGKFQIFIPRDGKSVRVTGLNMVTRTLQFEDSLYDSSNQMSLNIQVAPKSTLTVYSFYYQY